MEHFLFVILTILVISFISAVSGFFYSRYKSAKTRVKDLRRQKDKHLDPLMSSSELSYLASKLIKLRDRARKLRDT